MKNLIKEMQKKNHPETSELAEKIKNKDPEAFDILYREYSEKIYAFAMKKLKNAQDAEDVVSETFVSVLNNSDSLRDNSKLVSWIYTIAKNKINNVFNKENGYRSRRYEIEKEENFEKIANDYSDDSIMIPEDFAVNEERKKMLADIINSLSDEQKQAIYLYYYKDMPIKQIAHETGVSENTVKTRMALAKKYIKKKIETMRREGVVFSAVPISLIFTELGDSVNAASPSAGAATFTTGGIAGGISVAAISVAVLVGFSVMSNNFKDKVNIDNTNGEVRLADSISDSLSDSSYYTISRKDSSETDETSAVYDDSYPIIEPEESSNSNSVVVPSAGTEPSDTQADPQAGYIEIPSTPDTGNDGSSSEAASGWEEIQLTDGSGNVVSNHLWYFEENESWFDYDEISYAEVTHIKTNGKGETEIRYVIHSDSISKKKYRPYFEDVSENLNYYPDKIYEDNGEMVAQFDSVPRELMQYYTFEGSYYVDKIDENGVYYLNDDGTLSMIELFISSDFTFTIEKNVRDLPGFDFEGEYEYIGQRDQKIVSKNTFFGNLRIDKIEIEQGNPYYYLSGDALYFKPIPDADSLWLIWLSDEIDPDYFRIPDNVTAVVKSEIEGIQTDHLDLGDNYWIISGKIYTVGSLENVRTLTFSLGSDACTGISNNYEEDVLSVYISDCENLENINIKNGIIDKKLNLSFPSCPNLKSVTIDNGVKIDEIHTQSSEAPSLVFKVYRNSPAYYYVKENNLPFVLII